MGIASGSYRSSTIAADNITLYATCSKVTSTGACSVASMGIALYSSGTSASSTITANRAKLYAANSTVAAILSSTLCCSQHGLSLSYSVGSGSTIIANDAMLYSANSNNDRRSGFFCREHELRYHTAPKLAASIDHCQQRDSLCCKQQRDRNGK